MKAMIASVCAVLALAGAASARPMSLSLAGPSLQSFSNGGGTGFGGTLGNPSASIGMEIVGANLRITFTPGNAVNDYVAVFLNTRAGGFDDAAMNDTGPFDSGRAVTSNLTRDLNDFFPADMSSLPDFSAVFWTDGGGNQSVGFELAAGGDGSLIYAGNYTNNGGGQHSILFPLAMLGSPGNIDWFAAYCSGTNYNSNETMPAQVMNGGPNPGFSDAQGVYEYWNRYTVPAPSAAALLGLGGLALGRRRRA